MSASTHAGRCYYIYRIHTVVRQTDRQTADRSSCALIGWNTCLLGRMSQFSSHCMMSGRRQSQISNMFDIQNLSGRRRKRIYRAYICLQSISHKASENVGEQSPILRCREFCRGAAQMICDSKIGSNLGQCVYKALTNFIV